MTLEELLADAQVADDLEVSFGDKGKFKVSDLRAADKSRKVQAAAAEKAQADAMTAIAAKQKELSELGDQAAKLIEQYKTAPEPKKEGEIDFDTDPLFSPLVQKKLKPMEEKYAAIEASIKQLQSTFADSAKFIMQDYFDRRWNSIPEADRPKDKGWKDYLKIAGDKKILNEFGLPDPVEAFNREREPVLRQSLADENKKLVAQIEELKKTPPRMPRPGASGAPKSVSEKDSKPFESADALIDAAFADPIIQSIAGQA